MILTHINPLPFLSRTSNNCVKNICFTGILVQAESCERVDAVMLACLPAVVGRKKPIPYDSRESVQSNIRNLISQLTIIG